MLRIVRNLRTRILAAAFLFGMLGSRSDAQSTITLINANVASEYMVTSMQLNKAPACPIMGYLWIFPGGTLIGRYITDMARSKSIQFNGAYTLTNGTDIKFTSEDPTVPIANMNGTIARAVSGAMAKPTSVKAIKESKFRPVAESFVITTNSAACPGGTYKLTTFEEDEE